MRIIFYIKEKKTDLKYINNKIRQKNFNIIYLKLRKIYKIKKI